MGRWAYLLPLSAAFITVSQPARADDTLSVSLKAGSLADALRDLSAISGTGILFSPEMVDNRRSPRIVGRMSLQGALKLLLERTGLDFQRTRSGTIVILSVPDADVEPSIPEILIVGQKSQNVDIPRSENDIQPYQVATTRDMLSSSADTVDQFLRTRLPSNAVSLPPSQIPSANFAANRSEVNLHGLGAEQTLVLIDGARMPSIPALGRAFFYQPDLNGIPLLAIDRIESLTATAGGIYGPGATGGILNVVLKRDYRGADLSINYGLTSRGDAATRRIDGRIGFTPDQGRTDVMIIFSRSDVDGLRLDSRPYSLLAREIAAKRDPAVFTMSNSVDGITFASFFAGDLSLKPGLGGTSLGSPFTFLPIGYSGITADGGATLLSNAGKASFGLSPDSNGTQRSLVSGTETTSLLTNIRYRVSDSVEAFVDLVAYQNDSHVDAFVLASSFQLIDADAPTNPFNQSLLVTIPLPGFNGTGNNRLGTFRLSAGLIARFPRHWRAEAGFSLGRVRNAVTLSGFTLQNGFAAAMELGVKGENGEPLPDPFGSWDTYVAALQAYKVPQKISFVLRNQFEDASLRLAGPLFSTRAGPISLSLLAEHRSENVPDTRYLLGSQGSETASTFPQWRQSVSSLSGEMRAPLLSRDSGPSLLHGLELQLALRFDDIRSRVPVSSDEGISAGTSTARQTALAYTAGLRFFPQEHLMLRASLATGALPPLPDQMVPHSGTYAYSGAADPMRAGRIVGTERVVRFLSGGSSSLQPERARSFSIGLVLNPDGSTRPRLSLDYTHVDKTNEIGTAHDGDIAYFIDHESEFPSRVTRAPLTAVDRAAGFTGGIVTDVDATALNIGRTMLDTVDVKLDYSFPVGSDLVHLYGAATWQPRLKRRLAPDIAAVNYVGFADGPLEWRGNTGFDWTHGRLTLAVDGQYYNKYTAIEGEVAAGGANLDLPGVQIPAQAYVDIAAVYRLRLPALKDFRTVDVRLAITNLFDHGPPIVTGNDLGYSLYGDARGRRLEATISAHF